MSEQRSRRHWLNIHVWPSEPGLKPERAVFCLNKLETVDTAVEYDRDMISAWKEMKPWLWIFHNRKLKTACRRTCFTPEGHWLVQGFFLAAIISQPQKNSSQFLSDETYFLLSSYLWRNHKSNALVSDTEQDWITQSTLSDSFPNVGKWDVFLAIAQLLFSVERL